MGLVSLSSRVDDDLLGAKINSEPYDTHTDAHVAVAASFNPKNVLSSRKSAELTLGPYKRLIHAKKHETSGHSQDGRFARGVSRLDCALSGFRRVLFWRLDRRASRGGDVPLARRIGVHSVGMLEP